MPSLVSLAEQLLSQAKAIEAKLEQHNIPQPSFDADTLQLLPEDAQSLRWDLIDTSHILRQLARGGKDAGLDISFGWVDQLVLRIIWKYNLALAVPLDGSATFDEIAAASGLERSLVVRTIRLAVTLNIFDVPEPDRVRHTAISRLLAEDEGYRSVVGLQLEDIGPAGLRLIEAWEKYGQDTSEPGQSAFGLENGGRSLFTVLAEEPERAHRFDSAMKYCVEDKDLSFHDVANAFDWSNIDKPGSRLIDLGGGYGQISQALAARTEHLAFTVQDLPHVVKTGRQKLPAELQGRISFEAHDFLESQRPDQQPPDAYLISRCLHNWSNHHSALILRHLIPRLKKGSRVLIWDSVLDDSPVRKLSNKFNLQQDFIMATISNGTDRTVEEFKQVLKQSDDRFVYERLVRPDGSKLSMIEVSWNG